MEGLTQRWGEANETLFEHIDSLGGWPMESFYVTIRHSGDTDRPCYFGNEYKSDEYNTTIVSRDEYLYWKLTPDFKAKLASDLWDKLTNEAARILREANHDL